MAPSQQYVSLLTYINVSYDGSVKLSVDDRDNGTMSMHLFRNQSIT